MIEMIEKDWNDWKMIRNDWKWLKNDWKMIEMSNHGLFVDWVEADDVHAQLDLCRVWIEKNIIFKINFIK